MANAGEQARPRQRYFYGRRKGHRLGDTRATQMARLLPALELDLTAPPPDPLRRLFGPPVSEVWLEIGFGSGEHLVWQARTHPQVGLVGVEPFVNGVSNLITELAEAPLANVRLHVGEAQGLLDWLPEASIARTFVLFPDPWPKKRHHKRRLVSEATAARLVRVLAPGAELRVATDIGDYARQILAVLTARPELEWLAERSGDWRERTTDWPATRYEWKAIAAGRRRYYFRFRRR